MKCTDFINTIILIFLWQGLTGIQEKRSGPLTQGLFWCVITWTDLSQTPMMNLAIIVWALVKKHNSSQTVVGIV